MLLLDHGGSLFHHHDLGVAVIVEGRGDRAVWGSRQFVNSTGGGDYGQGHRAGEAPGDSGGGFHHAHGGLDHGFESGGGGWVEHCAVSRGEGDNGRARDRKRHAKAREFSHTCREEVGRRGEVVWGCPWWGQWSIWDGHGGHAHN